MAASLTAEPSERRLYPGYMREMIDEGFASTKRRRASFGAVPEARGTAKLETRETGCDDETGSTGVDRIGIRGDERRDEGM
ncbi:hypothetical protein Sjap_004091 [Stephania japonica]|uniref:Uncharacterized protein n=1 Tax=Stephania japonica TaxID=461633 RepID=A0AAP0PGQ1_9MAGN